MFKGAIIGFGNAARYSHWPAYDQCPDTQIIAAVDESGQRRAEAAKISPSIATFSTIDQLAKSGAKIDFVDICTPPAFHGEQILQALDRCWHVLCEKPFLLDEKVLARARANAENAERCLLPVHNWKYAPIIRAATNVLRRGAIGPLAAVEVETLRMRDSAAADPLQPNWRRQRRIAGGGILMDHGWHAIYLILDWFREKPLSVEASLIGSPGYDVEDETRLTINFPSGTASVFLSWNASARRNRFRLVGRSGEILINDDTLIVDDESTRFQPALSATSHHEDWFAAMLPDTIAAFGDPALARSTLDEAELCLTLIQQAYKSAGHALTASVVRRTASGR